MSKPVKETGTNRTMANERQWLEAEQAGQDEVAERMFARAIAGLPRIQPSESFVIRTSQGAWRARARRRRAMRMAYASIALLVGIIGVAVIYEVTPLVPDLIANAALAVCRGLTWLLTAPAQGAEWWWFAERIGTAIMDTIAAPSTAAIIGTLEMIGLFGIYAFRQLLRED
jgi:hypothetical protein